MMKNRIYDVVVIGAGAAGMVAAGVAAMNSVNGRVLLVEKMEKCGRKIRITGKGRCNVTNNKPFDEFISKVRAGADFVTNAYTIFDNRATADFFESIGVPLKTEQGGRLYPASGDAWSVANGLESWCIDKGVEICYNTKVLELDTSGKQCRGLLVEDKNGKYKIECKSVIIATGGASYPRTGSDGDGYQWAYDAGHSIEPIRPSLVPFDIKSSVLNDLKGLILKNIKLSLSINEEIVGEEIGEVEFFSFGVGGGAIFRLSRRAVDALCDGDRVKFIIDLKPALSEQKILARMDREVQDNRNINLEEMLRKFLPSKLVFPFVKEGRLRSKERVAMMSDESKNSFVRMLKSWEIDVVSHRGFKEAVVTAGGVNTTEIDPYTMESLIVKGVYFAGEVIDIDADTGGYNLQLAFSTGYLAGISIFNTL